MHSVAVCISFREIAYVQFLSRINIAELCNAVCKHHCLIIV